MQQDAHEFFNFLLNAISEVLADEKKKELANGTLKSGTARRPNISNQIENSARILEGCKQDPTWIQDIFQGTLTNETRCLNCETISSKDEDFLDLSVDIEQVNLFIC